MSTMRAAVLLASHLLVLLAKSLKRGGIKSVTAENLLLKQQLIVMGRTRLKAPNLNESDRFIFGYVSLVISAHRRLITCDR